MSVFNQSRSGVIKIIFGIVFLIIIGQLVNLQVLSKKYKIEADNNAIYRRIIYPDRGIIFDRKKRALLENTITYDLVVTPTETKGTDTLGICSLLNIDTGTYRKRIKDIIFKNGSVRPSVFEPLLTPELYAKLYENMYKFPGFVLSDRSVRSYPFSTGAAFLGYTSEVDTSFLRKHKEEGYESGDYVGFTGLERSYEKVLMGKRGVKRFIRDNKGRIQGPFEKGEFDTTAVAGKNLYASIDVELQQLGEKLMTNKVGSIVAIDPRTGGILCMISAPTYNPNYLTGNQRKKHISEMILDPRLPFNNRALGTKYSPGSTFKTVVGVAGLAEGVINKHFTVSCGGAFYGCNNGKPKCLDKGTFDFVHAIAVSDNTYFATVYKRILDQYKYGSTDSSLKVFNRYASSFGLGNKLGVDLPAEKRGNLPLSADYHKIYGNSWNACTIISNSIGQGEVQTTLVQLANVMATIANKGWYYTPHIIDSIEGGDEYGLLDSFKIKRHTTSNISDTVFDAVQDGMQGVMDYGTGQAEKIPGFVVCGKTGTVENYDHGKKQKDHAFFGGFAPRTNPRIAIAVMCENAGFGAASAAPIASLMMERYLKDTIPEKDRQDKVEQIAKTNLIPALMRAKLALMDSLKQVKEAQIQEQQKEKEVQDTLDDDNFDDSLINNPKPRPIVPKPVNNNKKVLITSAAILTEERKYFTKKNAKA
jgi:penicillin-binding protein 2